MHVEAQEDMPIRVAGGLCDLLADLRVDQFLGRWLADSAIAYLEVQLVCSSFLRFARNPWSDR